MEKMLRAQIVGEVRQAMTVVMEQMEERWISPKELSEHFSFFSKDWLSHYGHLLPREHVTVNYDHMNDDGELKECTQRTTAWGYPLHKINRMVAEGAFRELEWKEKMKENKKES